MPEYICPICKRDLAPAWSLIGLSPKEGAAMHMDAHIKESSGELIEALREHKDKLPGEVKKRFDNYTSILESAGTFEMSAGVEHGNYDPL